MDNLLGEFMGTLVLMVFGVGVNANLSLAKSYAKGAGWICTAWGWGLAVGVWTNKEELKSAWKLDVRFEPVMAEAEAAKLYKGWRKAVKHAMHWLDEE